MADYYDLLGVGRNATADEIKRAYRRMARQLHPDVNRDDPAAEERFKEISTAYAVLSDPDKRQRYDLFGEGGVRGGPTEADFGFGLGDVMDAFFGGDPFGARNRPRSRARRGRDLGMRLRLTFEESIFGTSKEVRAHAAVTCDRCDGRGAEPGTEPVTCRRCNGSGQQRVVRQSLLGQLVSASPCPACDGSGMEIPNPCIACRGQGRRAEEIGLTLDIPPGLETGTQVRFPGRGDAGQFGGPPGDLFIEAEVEPHPVFSRRDDDLLCTVPVPLTVAALGGSIPLQTLDGDEEVEVEPGTQGGTVVRFRRLGVPHPDGRGRGDLLVELAVETPVGLDDEQRSLLRRLAELRDEHPRSADRGFFARLKGGGR